MDDPQKLHKSGLGSLAQSARAKHLKSARWHMILIGVLTIAYNLFLFSKAADGTDKLIDGAGVALGAVFVVLGIVVYVVPVAATVLGLVLYIGGSLAFAALEPASLMRGIIVKIIIVVALFRAIQSAVAYERERRAKADVPEAAP